jgi:hypothetical protein
MLFSHSKNYLLILLICLCSNYSLFAQQENTIDQTNLLNHQAKPKDFKLSIGVFGLVNGSFLSAPDEKTLELSINQNTAIAPLAYPGFGGVGGGAGLNLEFSWRFVGLSFDIYQSKDQGSGKLDLISRDMGQSAWHLPLMLKLMIPNRVVTPYAIVGWEWVKPNQASWEDQKSNIIQPGINIGGKNYSYGAYSQNYDAFVFGLGLDIRLLPSLSMPIRLRGHHSFMKKDTLNDVMKATDSQLLFRSQWEWQAELTIGLKYDYSFDL